MQNFPILSSDYGKQYKIVSAAADSPAGLSLDPSLTAAVLGILDVLSCVQQRPTVKAPIDVSAMRGTAAIIYNVQQSVTLLNVSNAAQPTPVFASQMRFR